MRLIDWALRQETWVQDSLLRIALAQDHSVADGDFSAILANVRAAAGAAASTLDLTPLDARDMGDGAGESRRTVLAQLGPVQGIDRLAGGQKLRMAPAGITLFYGENGSGKSGYTRIAKRLCRSLTADQLRGNVFSKVEANPMRVEVRYRVGDDEVSTIDWDPNTAAPSVLKQISVFDSQNARLYVDGDNRIAYLPRELAILEHHGELCQRMAAVFNAEEKSLNARLRVALPTGYAPKTRAHAAIRGLDPKSPRFPSEDELLRLTELSEEERNELKALERELASDPVAQAAVRQKSVGLLTRVDEILGELSAALSDAVGGQLASARLELLHASNAEQIAATAKFSEEPLPDVGGGAWRILFQAALAYACQVTEEPQKRLPDVTGELCLLCQEPLSPSGAARLLRFNDFVSGEASRRADQARGELKNILEKIEKATVPPKEVVAGSLDGYASLDTVRSATVADIIEALNLFLSRRSALLDESVQPTPPVDVLALRAKIVDDVQSLKKEVAALQQNATHTELLNKKRDQLADLKDRVKLGNDIETMLQRLRDVVERRDLADCIERVSTRAVSSQITHLRKQLVTDELERRITSEIQLLDLTHLPFKVKDSSAAGQSLFSVGLHGAGKAKNNQVLSEGEQRALALACFLAEIGGDDAKYGIIIDDPVSSLDHIRLRKVAQRLIVEAKKGRQVIIFTHNLVFFNEMVSEAARAGDAVSLVKTVVTKTQAEGFGIVTENSEPWVADLNSRITKLQRRASELKAISDYGNDDYRRQVKDFYSDLRETWERAVEEVVLAKTVVRFVPDVMTGRLKEVNVTDDDYSTIYFAMKRASERSGHDMSIGRDIPQPTPQEMEADIKSLDDFRVAYKQRQKVVSKQRSALEEPRPGELI